MNILESLKTVAFFLIAAGLFTMSYVIYDRMGKHGRYTPVDITEDVVVVMDTHTGQVWSMGYELEETDSPKALNYTTGKAKRLSAKLDK